MHLKLRQQRQVRRFRSAAKGPTDACNELINKDLGIKDTSGGEMPKLAADVHLCSVDKYGESSPVQKKVLIVDDSPSEVRLMQGLLEKEGYEGVGLNDPKLIEQTITAETPAVIL